MAYPHKDFVIPGKNVFYRKDNYWTTQTIRPPPWYLWDNNELLRKRTKSESNVYTNQDPDHSNYNGASFRKDCRDYLLTTTLHGLRYVGEKKLTWFERFFWLASFVLSVICASFFIMNVYAKWRLSPMIVSINPENMPLSNLPFPAITICNVNQAKKTVAERYKKFGNSVDKKLLESLCSNLEDAELFQDEVADEADWKHTRSFLINVTQPCHEMLAVCIYNSILRNCEDLFNAQLTDEGLCCTFNVVHREMMFRNPKALNDLNLTFPLPAVDWTPEDGYPPDAPDDGFPWRPKGVGTHHGLTLILNANVEEYYCASTKSAGFKILLHNPTETPKITNLGEIYGPGTEARVTIQPRILDAQPALKSIDIQKRHCVFSSERELVFFRTYTLRNCEMECEARSLLNKCKCVLYYMPKNKTTRVCGKSDAKCYSNIKDNGIIEPPVRQCEECLPACTEISYSERMTLAPLSKALVGSYIKTLDLGNKSTDYFVANMLVVHFFFEGSTFLRFTKGEIFGLTEFLSNTGGLLGLCMGFSIMSAVELVYFVSLRILCMVRRNRIKEPNMQFIQ